MTQPYNFRLFVSGATKHSMEAVKDVKRLCEKYCKNNYNLEIIDIFQQPGLAEADRIIAAPTLIKDTPLPAHRVIGTMKDMTALRAEFDL